MNEKDYCYSKVIELIDSFFLKLNQVGICARRDHSCCKKHGRQIITYYNSKYQDGYVFYDVDERDSICDQIDSENKNLEIHLAYGYCDDKIVDDNLFQRIKEQVIDNIIIEKFNDDLVMKITIQQ